MNEINLGYSEIVALRNQHGFTLRYYKSSVAGGYAFVGVVGTTIFRAALCLDEVEGFEASVKSTCTLESNYGIALANSVIAAGETGAKKRDASGYDIVSSEKPAGDLVTLISPDWTDKTTWYQAAVRVVDEVATTTDYTTYQLAHTNVIDTYHGKLSDEDYLVSPNEHSYRVTVKVDGVTKTEKDPHDDVGDYTINYASGQIVFGSTQDQNAVIEVTYHYATTSDWLIAPLEGVCWDIVSAEVQFTEDIEITDTMIFQFMIGDQPYGAAKKFKGMKDYINDSTKVFPSHPALGGTSWRGLTQPVYVFHWEYTSRRTLDATYGLGVRIKLEHDVPLGGSYATATLYCRGKNC